MQDVRACRPDIRYDEIELQRTANPHQLLAALRRQHLMAGLQQRAFQELARGLFVVGDNDVSSGHAGYLRADAGGSPANMTGPSRGQSKKIVQNRSANVKQQFVPKAGRRGPEKKSRIKSNLSR